jgi:uncharacterized protein YbjQ (UPF0145 family)
MERLHYFINPNSDYAGYAFTAQLTGEDFWLTSDRDFQPLGLVRGHCIYAMGKVHNLVTTAKGTLHGEIKQYTDVMYKACGQALSRLRAQADELGADGVVSVVVQANFLHKHEWFEIVGTGTAVRYVGENPAILEVLLAERSRFVE